MMNTSLTRSDLPPSAARPDAGPVRRRRTQQRRQGPSPGPRPLCLCFPDAYSLGTSHHGLQVLYTLMNDDPQWACERAFAPWLDFEAELRKAGLPLYGLETFTPLRDFDLLGFSLQYEVCYTNILTMLDLGGVPLHGKDRTLDHPLVIAGGPGAQNPEVLAPFIDLFVIGDGEESLPWIMDRWMSLKERGGTCRAPT